MAIPPIYNVGTASINAGEAAVTGQGTTWLTSGIREGDLFWAAGLVVRIASVNSNTSMTLAYAWPGTNRAAAAYEIRYTPDSERVLAATRQMLTALASNAVVPLAGLAPSADKLAYYTGAGTAALTDIKAIGRALLAATTLTASREAVGANDASGLTTGAFRGWGSANIPSPIADLNSLIGNGLFAVTAGASNVPSASSGWGYILQFQRDAERRTQLFTESFSTVPKVWARILHSSGWSAWLPITPERGSNANGEYVRFADGTQICFARLTGVDITTAVAGFYRSAAVAWTFPAAFVSGSIALRAGRITNNSDGISVHMPEDGAVTTSAIRAYSLTSLTARILDVIIIGRWF